MSEEQTLPSVREMAAALVQIRINELEARVAQAFANMQVLQIQLQAAKMRAPQEVERLVGEMGGLEG